MRILASTACLPWMGSYWGSKSLSTSTPSLLFGRSMIWPLDASTMKSLPRNLFSVLDLVGDSTTTRFLPLALSPRLASISASSTGASGLGGAARFALADAVLARFGFSPAGSAAFFLLFFSSAGVPAAASVRDFLVAMRILPGDRSILRLEHHARRHVACARQLDRSLLVRGECLEHALQLVRIERAAGAEVQEVAPGLGRQHVALLGREHALRRAAELRDRVGRGLAALQPAAGETAQ